MYLRDWLIRQTSFKLLADQLGMTTVMISLYVQNKRQPKLETLIKISEILKIDINKLIETKKP